MTELRVRLPDDLAREASAQGLLTPQELAGLLRRELRRRGAEQLLAASDRMANLPGSAPSATEIEAEIEAARRQRRGG